MAYPSSNTTWGVGIKSPPPSFASHATNPISGIAEALSAVATATYLISHLCFQVLVNPGVGQVLNGLIVRNGFLTKVIL